MLLKKHFEYFKCFAKYFFNLIFIERFLRIILLSIKNFSLSLCWEHTAEWEKWREYEEENKGIKKKNKTTNK